MKMLPKQLVEGVGFEPTTSERPQIESLRLPAFSHFATLQYASLHRSQTVRA